jgi:Rod binding domain-containing protein
MNVNPLQPSAGLRAKSVPLERLAGDARVSETEKLQEACRQFEAILVRQILGEATKTVFKSELTHDSAINDIYRDMMTTELADAISQSGALKLGDSLARQLQRPDSSKPPSHAS